MNKNIRCYKFPDQRYLKIRWHGVSTLKQWRALRSIAAREHLWTRPRYKKLWGSAGIRNCRALLHQRRIEVAKYLSKSGVKIPDELFLHRLPSGPSGFWLEILLPWKGP
ncbi:hypothetical protein [Aquipseudomonas guryensis]|uniref:Uncharacterized protein n=1 Tax=Aquipseudomonas guryensis TaxID=2759165 RepID=A0A7W4DD64_9GAMM|nr:hypothetical protein [Pseudomonas guryensis]MBB1520378.1 hypothetical protein [Pseudomonas guryensis]